MRQTRSYRLLDETIELIEKLAEKELTGKGEIIDKAIKYYAKSISECDEYIKTLLARIDDLHIHIETLEEQIRDKNEIIEMKDEKIKMLEEELEKCKKKKKFKFLTGD